MSPWLAVVALLAIAAVAIAVAVTSRRGGAEELDPAEEPASPTLAAQAATRVAAPREVPAARTPVPAPRPSPSLSPQPVPSLPPQRSPAAPSQPPSRLTAPRPAPRPIPPGATPTDAPRLRALPPFEALLPDPEDLSESEDDKPTIAIQSADHYDVNALGDAELDEPGDRR
jgi:hypothetical protein